MEAQGFHPCVEDSTSEAREELKSFLKRKLPQTKDMLVEGLSGLTLPPIYAGGDAADKACSLWAGLLFPHMCPSSGRLLERVGKC